MEFRQQYGVRKMKREPVAVYQNAVEVQSVEECRALEGDPDLVYMQALLIRERVLGPCHPQTSRYISIRGLWYVNRGNFEHGMLLLLHLLEAQILHRKAPCRDIVTSLKNLERLFSLIFHKERDDLDEDNRKEKFVEAVVHVLELGVEAVRRFQVVLHQKDPNLDMRRMLMVLKHVISLTHYIPSLSLTSSSSLAIRFQQAVYQLVKRQVCDSNGDTLLHHACEFSLVPQFPYLSVVRLLLHVGADPNAQDHSRHTALHMVCRSEHINMPLVKALVEGGAHTDMCDSNHVSPLDRLGRIRSSGQGRAMCPVANTTLKCLAARTIAHSRFLTPNVYKGTLGKDLEQFIDMHCHRL